MTPAVFAAVLAAAALHAVWNGMIKNRLDRFSSITLMTLGAGIAVLPFAPFVAFPGPEVWPFIAASVMFHTGYKLFLIRAYEAGDLSQTYPLARGTAPLLTAAGGVILVSEVPGPVSLAGILLLSAGTLLMSLRGGNHLEAFNRRAVGYALATSLFVSGYTLSDGSGARAAASASSYAVWLFIADGVWFLMVALYLRRNRMVAMLSGEWINGLLIGLISAISYWIAMWAMTKAPIASVAALRESSILFALLISVLALGEQLTRWRLIAAIGIVAGVVALRLG